MFHDANAPLADGFRRKELLSISDHDFENKHGFIQWAFPTSQESRQVSSAPVLDLASAIWLAEKPDVTEFLEAMTVRFLEFQKTPITTKKIARITKRCPENISSVFKVSSSSY